MARDSNAIIHPSTHHGGSETSSMRPGKGPRGAPSASKTKLPSVLGLRQLSSLRRSGIPVWRSQIICHHLIPRSAARTCCGGIMRYHVQPSGPPFPGDWPGRENGVSQSLLSPVETAFSPPRPPASPLQRPGGPPARALWLKEPWAARVSRKACKNRDLLQGSRTISCSRRPSQAR